MLTLRRLDSKVAIVTGGGTGIGEAIAHKFAQEGARVVVNGLPGDPVLDVVQAIEAKGGRAVPFIADISEPENAQKCVQTAIDAFGSLNILINNAGVFLTTSEVHEYSIEVFDETVTKNIRSVFLMTRFAVPELQKTAGNIISTGSEAGMLGLAQNTPYGGTKGWIHAFTKGVAVEQAKYGIRANCVCPGPIDTAWTHKESGPMDDRMEQNLIAATPMGRRGTPEEIANVFAFLASDMASYVTGALWAVDGGTIVGKGPVGNEVPRGSRNEPTGELDLEHSHDGNANKNIR
ncbi:dihydroanticapsin 7-dehydrogenase [Abditibacteriota bacterium]|nr:dihydroanticapsin 7-dehydrogenase [Abditibacteriota bacterium]